MLRLWRGPWRPAMQRARARWSAEAVVSSGILIFGLMTVLGDAGFSSALALSMLIGGAAWIVFVSLFNVVALNRTPAGYELGSLRWRRSCFKGRWPQAAQRGAPWRPRMSIHVALIGAGIGTIGSTVLGLSLKLPEATVDLTPWIIAGAGHNGRESGCPPMPDPFSSPSNIPYRSTTR